VTASAAGEQRAPVRAAGGAVWRRSPDGPLEVVVVHRVAYDDWSLPKGKTERGESDEEAAIREVEEEAGVRCRLGPELPTTTYHDRSGRRKIVRYWAMTVVGGDVGGHHEVDDARWISLPAARRRLSYERDVEVIDALEAALAGS
jgi:8-oxo-dGTP pyrophosphatase MutT (NUDIX family)